jgi:methyl-accepting chemotaxis protein
MFQNSTIKGRLFTLTALMSGLLILVGIVGITSTLILKSGINEVYFGGTDAIYSLSHLNNLYSEKILDTINKYHDDLISSEKAIELMDQGKNEIDAAWNQYITLYKDKDPLLSDKLKNQIVAVDPFLNQIENAMRKGNKDEINDLNKKLYPTISPMNATITALIDSHVKETKEDYEYSSSTANKMAYTMLITILIGVLTAIFVSYYIIKSITTPLENAVSTIDLVSQGELPAAVCHSSQNEIGKLFLSMQRMIESSKKVIQAVKKVAEGDLLVNVDLRSDNDSLSKAINEMALKSKNTISNLKKEIAILSSSAEEIVASVSQVSSGTAETAAAVTETTTTVEELKQTAHISAEKAQDVLSKSEETLSVVKSSEQFLKATLDDMSQIQEKMRIISESIVKLSDHTLTIGKIIDSVNDLAEQSNLLAVNAAIEAAKAGDQGKGFGVVAQEIRALAEQSKAATIQVRSILSDIQNATNATVIATEQGSKAVSKGVTQSVQTTEAIKSFSDSILMVAHAAKQIAISSQQQLVGVDQVTVAMTNIKEATSQHVEHMKQIEVGVIDINKVGGTLKEISEQYKV